ncbi:hypothetical protein ACVIIV_003468 [Bradyrhizobium sp. USDA 4354]
MTLATLAPIQAAMRSSSLNEASSAEIFRRLIATVSLVDDETLLAHVELWERESDRHAHHRLWAR